MDNFHDEPVEVQLQLLTATVKLCLHKPKRTKRIVHDALNMATRESDNPDLRDRGFIYWYVPHWICFFVSPSLFILSFLLKGVCCLPTLRLPKRLFCLKSHSFLTLLFDWNLLFWMIWCHTFPPSPLFTTSPLVCYIFLPLF